MDRSAAESWIEANVSPIGAIELTHERAWSTVLRVPLAEGTAWFKACSRAQAFEPPLTATLAGRWPDVVPEVLAVDEDRGWLLLADAGTRIGDLGNPPALWLEVLPAYAELQRGETEHAWSHLAHGVPDLRTDTLAVRYAELLEADLPITSEESEELRHFEATFDELSRQLALGGIPDTVQHDDLHMNNVYVRDDRLRVLDWGDSSISHPFASLVPTFRFLEERNGLTADDPWIARIRDAYLEPWGRSGLTDLFDLAIRVGLFSHAIAALRQRDALAATARAQMDEDLQVRLRRALGRMNA
jgi:hypothetical protein